MPKIDKIKPQSFAHVIHAYLNSPKFKSLSLGTQDWIRRYLMVAEHPEALGAHPAIIVRPALVQSFLDGYSDRPGAQIRARAALCFLEKWAVVRDLLPHPITTGTEVVGSNGGHKPWTDAQVATAETYAQPFVARIITLAANTGQRGSDLYRMHPNDVEAIDGRPGINVYRKKNGDIVPIWIPFTQALIAAMATWERRPAPFLLNHDGKPFGNRGLMYDAWKREWKRNPQLAPCAGLVLHGLRATAIIRLRRAGCTPQQISDMVGLSVPMVERYCRFADQKTNAIAALYHLDRSRTDTEQERKIVGGEQGHKPLKD